MSQPAQKPGRSRQDFRTPPEFLEAVREKWHIEDFDIDLAASKENAVCRHYFTEEQDALKQCWKVGYGVNWCNPPFANIEPWVRRGWQQSTMLSRPNCAHTLLLLPAGVGSNWFRDWVEHKAVCWFLNGRLTFVGAKDPYPKDLILVEYHKDVLRPRCEVWNWRVK